MRRKIFLWLLATLLLTTSPPADAQLPGKVFSHRFPGSKHCFWYGGPLRGVPARAEQARMD